MDTIFAIGDPHGELAILKTLLKKWNSDNELLVITGDLVDRGADSYGVLRLAKKLVEEYGAKVLMGNHDKMFLDFLEDPLEQYELTYPQGGIQTINSFFDKSVALSYLPEHIAKLINEQFASEIQFLKERPYFYENGNHVFVHAGVNLDLSDWKNTSPEEMCWIREPFHYGKNDSGKIFVFGHTVTSFLNKDESRNVWISPCRTKIGIDGGAVFKGFLHGLRIGNDQHYEVCSVDKKLRTFEQAFDL